MAAQPAVLQSRCCCFTMRLCDTASAFLQLLFTIYDWPNLGGGVHCDSTKGIATFLMVFLLEFLAFSDR